MEKRPFIGKKQLEAVCAEYPTPPTSPAASRTTST